MFPVVCWLFYSFHPLILNPLCPALAYSQEAYFYWLYHLLFHTLSFSKLLILFFLLSLRPSDRDRSLLFLEPL